MPFISKRNGQNSSRKTARNNLNFLLTERCSVNADLMHLKHRYNYMENSELQFIEMPYKGGDASMFVLLPKNKDGLKGYREKTSHIRIITEYTALMQKKEVDVFFPEI
ncbi:TPA: hypothetical protein DCR49_06875 [Candidatus Delongbacteria bacterium]|nr:hypothetical protein [Candidatus Delongbacteria bacterium]